MEKTAFIKEKIEEIRSKLARPCTEFQAGGFRPSGERTESWIGRVFLCRPDEAKPVTDTNGNPLYPLAQFYLPALPYVPDALKHITWLTVFLANDYPEPLSANGEGWLIREYTAADEPVEYEFASQEVPKPLPLRAIYQEKDFPVWCDPQISIEINEEIDKYSDWDLAEEDSFDYFIDIATSQSTTHKFGGYPSFCQPNGRFGKGYEFMFQISSDENACFNVVDSGSLMFARNPEGRWHLYYDFY